MTIKEILLIKIIVPLIAILALGVIFLALLWRASPELLFWLAVVSLTLIAPSFLVGFWFGKTEVRGWLAGADTVLDKMANAYDKMDKVTERASKRTRGDLYLTLPGNTPQPLLGNGDVVDAQVLEM